MCDMSCVPARTSDSRGVLPDFSIHGNLHAERVLQSQNTTSRYTPWGHDVFKSKGTRVAWGSNKAQLNAAGFTL